MSLQVTGGELKGKKLLCPPGLAIRPTPGRVREAVFNILGPAVSGTHILDLFAGTGAVGIEALSRGAERAVFIDSSPRALDVARKNIAACGLTGRSLTLRREATADLGSLREITNEIHLVYADPPYNGGYAVESLMALEKSGVLAGGATIIVEHGARENIDAAGAGFQITDRRKYSKTLVSFLQYVVS